MHLFLPALYKHMALHSSAGVYMWCEFEFMLVCEGERVKEREGEGEREGRKEIWKERAQEA